MTETIIKVENLSKQYRIGAREGYRTFRETLVDAAKAPFLGIAKLINRQSSIVNRQSEETIWALKEVSFEVEQGQVVGIIGRNGAGKSTLLKILSKITEPTEGRVVLRGRVGSLLEVGTGFHPELTGHENIYLYGAILGMDRWEVTRKFDEIVAFAELEKFVDTPVKRYSSGMYMRLAFAVAAHLEPEILLVDEVLAVGDAAFQKKCLGKMGDVSKEGRTILFVSHNMPAVMGLCSRAILLNHGRLTHDDQASMVVHEYLARLEKESSSIPLRDRKDRSGDGTIRAVGIHLGTQSDLKSGHLITGEDATICIDYECMEGRTLKNIEIALGIHKLDQAPLLYLGTKVLREDVEHLHVSGRSVCTIKRLPLEPGRYSLVTEIKWNGIIVDCVQAAAPIEVYEGDFYGTGVLWPYGGFLCDYCWTHFPGGNEESSCSPGRLDDLDRRNSK